MVHNGASGGKVPARKGKENMSDWFEVVEGDAILFCGPREACEKFVAENDGDFIILPISF